MTEQRLVVRRPIICGKCLHGNSVEVITGREKTPVEYHCGCGNYAIVGVPARWPFMEVVKAESNSVRKVVQRDHDNRDSSPMQVGESLVKSAGNIPRNIPRRPQARKTIADKTAQDCKQEEVMPGKRRNPECKHKECTKEGAFHGFCGRHFHEEYGFSYLRYCKHRSFRGEDPKVVAQRWAEARETEQKPPKSEQKPPKHERKPPSNEVAKQEIPLFQIFLDPELLERLTKKAKKEYRTAEMHAIYLIDKGTRE